jgi:hypothetical protein
MATHKGVGPALHCRIRIHAEYDSSQLLAHARWRIVVDVASILWTDGGHSNKVELCTIDECFKSVDGSMSNQQVVNIGLVSYLDYETALLESNNAFAPLMCKRNVFEDDREVRAVLFADQFLESVFAQGALAGLYMPVYLSKLVDAVVVAPEAPDWMLKLVRTLIGTQCTVKRSRIAVGRRPDSPHEIELAKKIEAKVDEYAKSQKPLDDDARHQLRLAAMGHSFFFKDQSEYLAHRQEEEFVSQYIDWRINSSNT